MNNIYQTAFVIQPSEALLKNHPHLKHRATSLALSYKHNEVVTEQRLQQFGEALWQSLNIEEAFAKQQQAAQAINHILPIVIESDNAAIQNLPWELLYHPEQGFLGREKGFTLSRRTGPALENLPEPELGPLRVLLFSALPSEYDQGEGRLQFEEEQENVLEALMQPVAEGLVTLESPNDGRFDTLKSYLKNYQPHLVFLSGHGKFYSGEIDKPETGYGIFAFEDERGFTDAVKDKDLAEAFVGSLVKCCVLSACESSQAASEALASGLTRQLAGKGISHVIGMRESIFDRAGILFAQEFCAAIGRRERIDVALQGARQSIIQPLKDLVKRESRNSGAEEASYGQWCLPSLYSQNPAQPLINWQFQALPPTVDIAQRQLEGLNLPTKFRGRRRELRSNIYRLKQRELRQLAIIGPGGQGKTALAGQLALALRNEGWQVAAWCADPLQGKSFDDFVFDELELKLNDENNDFYNKRILPRVTEKAKRDQKLLELLVKQYQGKFLLVLDNLESLQNPSTREINDARLQSFIHAAQQLHNQGLTLIITSRWLPLNWPEAQRWPLEKLNYGDFLQLSYLRQEQLKSLAKRRERLREIHRVLNGNGRGLEFFSAAAKDMSLEEEQQFLEKLKQASEELRSNMALEALLEQLSQSELELLQAAQVYEEAVPIEGLIKIRPQQSKNDITQQVNKLVAYSLLQQSQHPYWLATEYHCGPLVAEAVNAKLNANLPLEVAKLAASYLIYLHDNERYTLHQALLSHRALGLAQEAEKAREFALDEIVGTLQKAGRYQSLLDDWLPELRLSEKPKRRAKALNLTGMQHVYLGSYDLALNYLKQSLAIRQEIGDKSGEGTTLNNISQIFQARGDYETALSYLKQSLAIQQETGNKSGEGTTLNNISQIYDARGDYETALSYLKQSLAIRQEIGDIAGMCATLFNIDHIYLEKEPNTAVAYWLECYKLAKPMQLAQALEALENLTKEQGGLDFWEARLQQQMAAQDGQASENNDVIEQKQV